MTHDADPAVTFHRTDEGHLAARLDGHAMIAFPARDGRHSVWSAFRIDRPPEQWLRDDFFITGTSVADENEFRAHATEYAAHISQRKSLPRICIRSRHSTPWGMADDSRRYADGVVFHSTPSHGGFELSAEANAKVHLAWRNADRFYEEDIDWAKVATPFQTCSRHMNARKRVSRSGIGNRMPMKRPMVSCLHPVSPAARTRNGFRSNTPMIGS